ncbi:hypothetical protein CO641_14525 [Lysobacteraceae bacterium NML91-0213]|nr:hypothetical protein CO641_14525 [Xanthomonadaceae bacterium NML91-0213]
MKEDAAVAFKDAAVPAQPLDGYRDVPQSAAQQRLCFLHSIAPDNVAYHVPWGFRLPFALDAASLEAALHAVVRHHEALRTTFPQSEGAPLQRIHSWLAPDFSCHALDPADDQVAEAELQAIAERDVGTPFDLAAGPLLRVRLCQREGGEAVLTFCAHHAIVDAWSIRLLMDELLLEYDAAVTGTEPEKRPVMQYAEAIAQQERAHGRDVAHRAAERAETLRPLPPRVALPFRVDERPGGAAATLRQAFPAGLQERIEAFARSANTTAFVTTLAIFNAVLARYGNTGEVIVGTPVFGRDQPGMDTAVGCFVNTVPVRTNVGGSPTFRDMVDRTKEATLAAIDFQDVPFESLVHQLGLSTGDASMPLLDVLFSHAVEPAAGQQQGRFELDSRDSKCPLVFTVAGTGTDVTLIAEYATQQFERVGMERLLDHFSRLAGAALQSPDVPITALEFFSADELASLESFPPATGAPVLAERFLSALREYPESIAVADESLALTYAQLDARATAISVALRQRGVNGGNVVALQLPRSCDYLAAILGTWRAGAAFLPIDSAQPRLRRESILADAKAACTIIASVSDEEAVVPDGVASLPLDELEAHEGTSGNSGVPDGGDLAYLIYTSGSTGRPKGVEVEHGSLANIVEWVRAEFSASDQDRFSQISSVGFDASLLELLTPLGVGAAVHIAPDELRLDPKGLAGWLVDNRISISYLPTVIAEELLRASWPESCALRFAYAGGDVLHSAPTKALPFRFYNFYGPTECTISVTAMEVLAGMAGRPGIGFPVAGARAYVLDAERHPVPDGVAGELHIGGVGVARGYRGLPDMTAERFINDPQVSAGRMYRTGDRVRRDADGVLHFLGRDDDQVKIRGYRIELAEVEAVLAECAGVANAAVVVGRGPQTTLHGFIAAGQTLDEQQLRERIAARLPAYMHPATVQVIERIPAAVSGKVDRVALQDMVVTDPRRSVIEPATAHEKAIAAVWERLLQRKDVGLLDSFFALGGHSLMAMAAVGEINAQTGANLTLAEFMREPTLGALAARLEATTPAELQDARPPIEAVPRDFSGGAMRFPQSPSQQRLWFIEQMERGGSGYNVTQAFQVVGTIDTARLQQAIDAIVERHDALRTTFEMTESGALLQVLHSTMQVSVVNADFRTLSEQEATTAAELVINGIATASYDLDAGPLLRVALMTVSEGRQMLLVGMHHIIVDAWSMGVFLSELSLLYASRGDASEAGLPPLHVQYPDYSEWQEQWMNYGVLEERLYYWQEQLKDHRQVRLLQRETPLDGPPRTGSHAFELPPAVVEACRAIAAQASTTVFVVLLAAYKLLLARYSAVGDVVVGLPVANRTDTNLAGVMGYFVNSLAVRTRFGNEDSFLEVIGHVRRSTIEAYQHQDMPLERFIERMNADQRWSRAPLFRTMVASSHGESPSPRFEGCTLTPAYIPSQSPKFDLILGFSEVGDRISVVAEYATDVIDDAAIGRISSHFMQILRAMTADPHARVGRVPLLDPAERERHLESLPLLEGETVLAAIAARTREAPLAVAVTGAELSVTYAELDAWSDRVAFTLREAGVKAGDLVAIALPRSVAMLPAMMGAWKAGAAYLPVDMDQPRTRQERMLEDAQIACVVLCADSDARDAMEGVPWISMDSLLEGGSPGWPEADFADLAYVVYTSGSTGAPKGVEVEHGSLARLAAWQRSEFALQPRDRCSQLAGAGFDASMLEWWATLSMGATLCIAPEEVRGDPQGLVRWFDQEAVTIAFIPTPLAELAFLESWPNTVALRKVLVGGDVLHRAPPEGLPFEVHNNYGPTEHTVVATSGSVAPGMGQRPSIGRPLPGVRAYILDGEGQMVPDGIEGELYLGGPGLARGYRGRPDLTSARFMDDPFVGGQRMYRTGDLVSRDSTGKLYFAGRADEQLKVRGHRVEPAEIEAVLMECGCIRQAVVVAEAVASGTALRAFVVVDGAFSAEEVGAKLSDSLPDYMHPTEVAEVDEIPLNASGKPDRKAVLLRDRADTHVLGELQYEAPVDPVETALVGIWQDLVEHRPIGRADDFFRIGGHSLNALVLRREIEKAFGVDVDIPTIFANGRLSDLAQRLRDSGARDRLQTDGSAGAARPAGDESQRRPGRLSSLLSKLLPATPSRRVDPRVQLVELRPGSGPTVALVHAVAGTVAPYHAIAEQLAGYRVVGIATDRTVELSFEEAGRAYANVLAAQAGQGAIVLAGWSAGGGLALETARSLSAQGAEVRGLLLLDAHLATALEYGHEPERQELLDRFVVDVARMSGRHLTIREFMAVDFGDISDPMAQAMRVLTELECLPSQFSPDEFAVAFERYMANYNAWRRYEPEPYQGRTSFLASSESMGDEQRNPLRSWSKTIVGSMQFSAIVGDHYDVVAEQNAVRVAAACSALSRGSGR